MSDHASALALRRHGLSWRGVGKRLGIGATTAATWAAKALRAEFKDGGDAFRAERARWFNGRPTPIAVAAPLARPVYPSAPADVDDQNDISFRDDEAFARLAIAEAA